MFTIALIGRTNVGKSTLFNRILGEGKAIVSALAHTTRDRNVGETAWRGVPLRFIDTGGVEAFVQDAPAHATKTKTRTTIEDEIRVQAQRAIAEANLLCFVIDVRDGILPGEQQIATFLRATRTPVIVACNKAETARYRNACHECASLGFGNPHPISATSGMGVGDLLDAIVAASGAHAAPRTLEVETVVPTVSPTRVAIVGEPNVGKSSLINAILGRDEVIVHEEAFTTRDVHETALEVCGHPVILLDTAGIRRAAARTVRVVRARIDDIERHAVGKSMSAIAHADVAVLVLDATRTASRHVKQLAQIIIEKRRACVIVVNKCDHFPESDDADRVARVQKLFPHLAWAPVISTSAIDGTGVPDILPTAIHVAANWRRTLSEERLAEIYATAQGAIPTPKDREGQRSLRTIELTQVGAAPPRFRLLTRRRVRLPAAIPNIMERALRDGEDFAGTPVIIAVKSVKA